MRLLVEFGQLSACVCIRVFAWVCMCLHGFACLWLCIFFKSTHCLSKHHNICMYVYGSFLYCMCSNNLNDLAPFSMPANIYIHTDRCACVCQYNRTHSKTPELRGACSFGIRNSLLKNTLGNQTQRPRRLC